MDVHEIRLVTLETSQSAAGQQLYPRASGRNLGQRAVEIWRGAGMQTSFSQVPIVKTETAKAGALKTGPMLPVDDKKKLKRQVNYEVHFFRIDGTLGLRLFTVASTDEEALSSVGKMQCAEFVTVKVWRGLDHVMVHNRPADPDSRHG